MTSSVDGRRHPATAVPDDVDGGPYQRWRDSALPVEERVADLLARMTIEEKVGQLRSIWIGGSATGDDLAPHQHTLADKTPPWEELIGSGLGHLTRTFGTAPVTAEEGSATLARRQTELMAANRFGIPAIAHEECLTGFMTLGATIFPIPLAWGATFDPEPGREDGGRGRREHARSRRAPGPCAGAGRDARPAMGTRRGDHRRGPLSGRHGRRRVCPRSRVGRHHRDAQTLRRILVRPRRPQRGAGRRSGRENFRTCSYPRSKWRYATPGPAR